MTVLLAVYHRRIRVCHKKNFARLVRVSALFYIFH